MPPAIADASPSEQDVAEFAAAVLAKLTLAVGKDAAAATDRDWFVATTLALRDRVIHRWLAAERDSHARGAQAHLLPVARIPDRPAVRTTSPAICR